MLESPKKHTQLFVFLIITVVLTTNVSAESQVDPVKSYGAVAGMIIGIMGGVIGAWFTWFQTRESKLNESRVISCDQALTNLWTLTSNLPLRPIAFDFTYCQLQQLTEALKVWYFKHGYLISEGCQDRFIAFQDLTIRSIISYKQYKNQELETELKELDLKVPLHPLVYIHCQIHSSLLRQSLVRHFRTRGFWSLSGHIFNLHHKYVRKEGYCKKYVANLSLFNEQMPNNYIWNEVSTRLRNEAQNSIAINKIKNKRRRFKKDQKLQSILHFDNLHEITSNKMLSAMITFVCGGPCSGKSTILRILGRQEDCDVCSADHIKIAIRDYLSEEESKKAHTNTYRAWDDFGYAENDANIYRGALEHSQVFWPALEIIANTYRERGEKLVIEGSFFTPEFARKFKHPEVRFVVCDPSRERHFAQAKKRNKNRKRVTPEGVENNSETMFEYGRIFHEQLAHGFRELQESDPRIEIWGDSELDLHSTGKRPPL